MSWHDPYGQYGHNPYDQQAQSGPQGWQDPYAQDYPPYAQPPHGPSAQYAPRSSGSTTGALVANIVAAVLCCGGLLWLPGIILASVATSRNNTDPESARQLTLWSWFCFVANMVVAIGLVVVWIYLAAHNSPSTTKY